MASPLFEVTPYQPLSLMGADLIKLMAPAVETVDFAMYLDAIGAMAQAMAAFALEQGTPGAQGYVPAYGSLFDVDACPTAQLPYLAQIVGVSIAPGTDDATARSLIRAEAGLHRGSKTAVQAAVQRNLSGTRSVTIVDRRRPDGSASGWWGLIYVRPEEVIDLAAIYSAVDAVLPAGMRYEVIESDSTTWGSATGTFGSQTGTWSTT